MKDYRVLLKVPQELYDDWKKHVKLIYGITPRGHMAGIMEKNSEIFCNEIKRLMRHENTDRV